MPDFAAVLENLPAPLREALTQPGVSSQQLSMTLAAFSASYAGPLPPAEQIRAYERVLPGSADRILSMAERQQEISERAAERAREAMDRRRDDQYRYEDAYNRGADLLDIFRFEQPAVANHSSKTSRCKSSATEPKDPNFIFRFIRLNQKRVSALDVL